MHCVVAMRWVRPTSALALLGILGCTPPSAVQRGPDDAADAAPEVVEADAGSIPSEIDAGEIQTAHDAYFAWLNSEVESPLIGQRHGRPR